MNGYLLDTNVVSETTRPEPSAAVRAWLSRQPLSRTYLSATVLGELAHGVARLPPGQRRRRLEAWLEGGLRRSYAGRILPLDEPASLIWGRLMGEGQRAGRTPAFRDCQIAAVAVHHRLTVATRDAAGFAPLGVATLNPWEAS